MRFSRPGYTDLVQLTWRRDRPGYIAITYGPRTETVDGATRSLATDALPRLVRYQITREDTPLAGRTTLLRLDPPIILARAFGLHTRYP
jgi:hypothetical protein